MYESLLESQDETVIQFLNYFHSLLDYAKQQPTHKVLQKFLDDSNYSC